MQHFFSLSEEQQKELFKSLDQKDFRRKQFCNWVYKKLEINIDNMTDISVKTREILKKNINLKLPKIKATQKSNDGTVKYLLELKDRNVIEMVSMPGDSKHTLCISSQVGCKQGCSFCATAKLGFKRNLTVDEIISQVYMVAAEIFPNKITNIVFMGMGEPLDNYENVIESVKLLQSSFGLGISPRRITISTCGLPNNILKLAESGVKVKLALSLNSAINEKRSKIMPINNKANLNSLKSALRYFRSKTAFRITLEYIMIKNFNMESEDIKALKKFAGDISCKLNLIPYNSIESLPYESPDENDVKKFVENLQSLSAAVTVRNSRGQDIAAACGQLAGKLKDTKL